MEADAEFRHLSKSFWADVRTIGEAVGYTLPRQNMVRAPTIADIQVAYGRLGLGATHLVRGDRPTAKGRTLVDYLKHRANVLNEYVSPRLMDVDRAKAEFERLLDPQSVLPVADEQAARRQEGTCLLYGNRQHACRSPLFRPAVRLRSEEAHDGHCQWHTAAHLRSPC